MLADGLGMEAARQTGWRHLFKEKGGAYMMAEVGMAESLNEHRFHHIHQGENVHSFIEIVEKLDAQAHLLERGYEINILRISPLYVKAIWLKGADHDHAFFLPLAPVNSMFEAGNAYEYEDFCQMLERAAQTVLNGA